MISLASDPCGLDVHLLLWSLTWMTKKVCLISLTLAWRPRSRAQAQGVSHILLPRI